MRVNWKWDSLRGINRLRANCLSCLVSGGLWLWGHQMPSKSKYKSFLEESIITVGLKLFLCVSFHRHVKYRIKDKQVYKETKLFWWVFQQKHNRNRHVKQLLLKLSDANYKIIYIFVVQRNEKNNSEFWQVPGNYKKWYSRYKKELNKNSRIEKYSNKLRIQGGSLVV